MKILLLGGPKFLGYALIESALEKGHELTLFNRGKTNPDLFPELEKIIGDRNEDFSRLVNGKVWDAVIDTCGYFPSQVEKSTNILKDHAEQYTFISSISVYENGSKLGIREDAAVRKIKNENAQEITPETYGPLKALCEKIVLSVFPGSSLVIRPGLIVGPHDPSDRFTYWPVRISRGGDVLAPGQPNAPIQFIDVRDLSDWIIRMIELKGFGVYNASGPNFELTMADLLYKCKSITKCNANFFWIEDEFLLKHHITPFLELPLWVPTEARGMMQVDVSLAVANGLSFRSLGETIRAVLTWYQNTGIDRVMKAGLAEKREMELLSLWKKELR